MYYEFNLGDIKEILTLIEEIREEVEDDLLETMQKHVEVDDSGTYPSSRFYYDGVIPGMEERQKELENIVEHLEEFEEKLDEIINAIEYTEAVEVEDVTFIYEPKELNNYIKNLEELLDRTNVDYKGIYKLSDSYQEWENGVTAKLDNPDAGLKDTVEELRQADDERVFRNNKKVMQGIDEKLAEVISDNFSSYISNLEELKEELDDLEVLDEIKEIAEIVSHSAKFGSIGNTTNVKIAENNITKNLVLFFGMSEAAANDLIRFYKDLLNSGLSDTEISRYFWGIQSGIGERYDEWKFMFVNGDYKDLNIRFEENYRELNDWLEDKEEGTMFDYQHLCATMSADAKWLGEYNNPIADVANWGMGDGGDRWSAIIGGNPGNFGIIDRNTDDLADNLQTFKRSSAAFMSMVANGEFDEKTLQELQKEVNGGAYE